MESRRIPAQPLPASSTRITTPKFRPNPEIVVFSFNALERNKYFNLDTTCPNWSSDLFEMLKEISNIKVATLVSGAYSTYRVHNHEKANLPCQLPEGVAKKDCYQMRISAAKGGIHGVFFENVFYVVWLDPLHNLYPNSHFGGLRIIQAPSTCCREREKELEELSAENKSLRAENDQLRKDNKDWEAIWEEEQRKKN